VTINHLKIILAFIITTFIMCVVNFIGQIVLIFIDVVSRMESSSALTIVLWIVTGVFAAIFTQATAEQFIAKKEITYRLVHWPILIISMVAIVIAVVLMIQGEFISDPADYTLLFSNGFTFISYFLGTGGFAFIGRKL
jgi:H+/Cl- antiporter ClcA